MKPFTLAPVAPALGAALGLLAPAYTLAAQSGGFGRSLPLTQRDVRVFNNFQDPTANDNQIVQANFPGALGAPQAIWKATVEWGSGPHGNGAGDPSQPNLGDGCANFDPSWQGSATSPGGTNDNIVSVLPTSCGGGTLAFTEIPIHDGWRIRFCEEWLWDDGPGGAAASAFDIQSVMTHQYGHAVGLGHSTVPGATMGIGTLPGDVSARSIEPDDIAALQVVYGVKAGTKPRIDSVTLTVNLVTIVGVNFDAEENEVWFTHPGGDGTPLQVAGIPSDGTTLSLFLPAEAGPGDVLVKVPGVAGWDLSNAYPFDPGEQDCVPGNYCKTSPNSIGPGAFITWFGTTSFLANDFGLSVGGAIPAEFGLFFYGPEQTQVPFGDGFLCVAGGKAGISRLNPPQLTDLQGGALRRVDTAQPPADAGPGQIVAGSEFHFQFWYRDPNGPGGSGFNFSDGLNVVFCP